MKEKNLNKNSANSFEFIFNEINNFIKENSGGSIDEILSLVETLTKAANKGELINLLSDQKIGQEELKTVLVPTLKLVKDILGILTKSRLELVVGNITDSISALEATLKKNNDKSIGFFQIFDFFNDFKIAFNKNRAEGEKNKN